MHRCGDIIRERGWQVVGVSSRDPEVAAWTRVNGLPTPCPLEELPEADYLFSIANSQILPRWLCTRPRRLSINLHDGPLPEFAGLHATTWGLLEGRTQHAISWHCIEEQVDAGDLLLQRWFPLRPRDTAGTANLECQRTVLESLAPLLIGLEDGSVKPQPQNLGRRTYYPLARRPHPILDFRLSALELDNLVRGHDFEPFPNPFGSVYLWNGRQLLRVRTSSPGKGSSRPGTTLRLFEPDGLEIACGQGALRLTVSTLEGGSLGKAEFEALRESRWSQLPSGLTEQLNQLLQLAVRAEDAWVQRLKNQHPVQPVTPGQGPSGQAILAGCSLEELRLWLEQHLGPGLVGVQGDPLPGPLDGLFFEDRPLPLVGGAPGLQPVRRDLFQRFGQLTGPSQGNWPLVLSQGDLRDPVSGQIRVQASLQQTVWRWGEGLNEDSLRTFLAAFSSWRSGPSQKAAKTVSERFLETAQQHPEKVAVRWPGGQMNYGQLLGRVLRLGCALCSQGVAPEEKIPVLAAPGPEMVVGWLGVLSCGATCIPLDSGREGGCLEPVASAGPFRRLLWDGSGACPEGPEIWDLRQFSDVGTKTPDRGPTASSTAFLFFTSGSTGQARAVAVSQVLDEGFEWHTCPLREADCSLLWSRPTVIDSLWQLLAPLLRGLPVVFLPREQLVDPAALLQAVQQYRITRLSLLPSFALRLAHERNFPIPPPGSVWALTGEPLDGQVIGSLQRAFPHVQLVNTYGSTEAGQVDTWWKIPQNWAGSEVPVGVTSAGNRVRIDSKSGEVLLGGKGLSSGFPGDPIGTARRWRPDASGRAGSRILRSGDLGSVNAQGLLLVKSRMDRQVLIRGTRVELEGVAAQLRRYPEVKEAEVVLEPEGLVAYYVGSARPGELRQHLSQCLPPEAIPSRWASLKRLPRLPGGKVDRTSLSAQHSGPPPLQISQDPPMRLVAKVLRQPHLSPRDNFFEVGGDSLLAVVLFQEIEKEFGVRLPLTTLLECQNVGELAQRIQLGSQAHRPRVQLRAGNEERKLIFFHPRGGGLLCYRELVQGLPSQHAVYGFTRAEKDPIRVEDLSETYLESLLEMQPQGPYCLIGYSYGGLLAHNLAVRLQTMGKPVALLVMLDSYGPQYRSLSQSRLRLAVRHLQHAWRRILLFGRLALQLPERRVEFLRLRWQETLRHYHEHWQRIFSPTPRLRIGQDYTYPKYSGPALLLRASLQEPGLPPWPDMGWSRCCSDLKILQVEGSHAGDLLKWPGAEGLARLIHQELVKRSPLWE